MTKTEQAIKVLKENDVANRGHAYLLLKQAGLAGSGRVFNTAVKAYEFDRGVTLGKSAAARNAETDADSRRRNQALAHQMSAKDVRDHIEAIKQADQLFWLCWRLFRDEGKWANHLSTGDFAVHFNGRSK